ncbi:MAG: hypothetical protein ACD_58C00305G0009 [uncultured bacterium]|nr:MAG: hypothetical protein ACD_58C00305G0009 [uncultured bacterium]
MNYQLGIYLLLPKEWEEVIGKIKKSLLPLSSSHTIPHISLYICAINKEDFDSVCSKLKQIQFKPFSISFEKIMVEKDKMYYHLAIKVDNKLNKLHEEIVDLINPIRDGLIRQKDTVRLKEGYFSQKQIESINKYGYYMVKDLFNPHITLGICKTKDSNKLIDELTKKISNIKSKSFEVKEITVGLFREEDDTKVIEKTIRLD